MADVKLNGTIYTGVEAVRMDNKNGETIDFAPYEETFASGKAEGIEEGYARGKADGITEGVQSEYDRFWDTYQDYGNLRIYRYAFTEPKWNDDLFRPKYDIICGPYSNALFWGSRILDIVGCLSSTGVKLDTSGAEDLSVAFANAATCRLPEISLINATNYYNLFHYAYRLEEIEKIVLKDDGSQGLNNVFGECLLLKHITIEGVIGATSNFLWCPLTSDSLESVITHLSDTTTGTTTTFNLSAVNTAFETAEGLADGSSAQAWLDLVASKPNWTISLV